jgi:peptidoglycan/LPS O-acetylase OafA/YrhL
VALGIAAYHGSVPWWLRHVVPPFMLALAINHIGQTYAWVLRMLSSRVLVFFGLWSYSLYLWHPMVMQPMDWLPGGIFGCFVLAMVMGLASYYLLERPARMWLNENWKAGTDGSDRAIGMPANAKL